MPTTPRPPEASVTVMHEIVLPSHTNALGTAFGGTIMSWIDVCGAITAQRHCRGDVVTASIDRIDFLAPVRLGDIVRLTGRICWAGRTSVETEVEVEVEHPSTGEVERTGRAFITFVAVDADGRPRLVPELALTTDDARLRYQQGAERRARRLELAGRT